MATLISTVAAILNLLLLLYVFVLLARLVLDYIPMFNPQWRPKGAGLVVAELVFTVTDPPLKFFRRYIRPARIGDLSLDFGFMLTMLTVFVLMAITRAFI